MDMEKLVILLVPIYLFIVYLTGLHIETSRGEHTGYVTAVQKSGLFFKTNTAYIKTDTQSSQEDSYCVIDEAVQKQLQEYSVAKTQVNLYFFGWFSSGITNCNGEGDIIYKVKPLVK